MKYKLLLTFENFNVDNDLDNYERELVRLSDDLDELIGILDKYINKFMKIRKDGWQYFTGKIVNLSVKNYALERNIYEVSLTKRGIGV